MFQNLYIRKASDDVAQQGEKQIKPYYPPVQAAPNVRKQSGSDRKGSEQQQEQEKKTKTPKTGPKEIYVEKTQVEKEKQPQQQEKSEKPPKVQQSPVFYSYIQYVEKKSNSRKTSEQIYVPKHKQSIVVFVEEARTFHKLPQSRKPQYNTRKKIWLTYLSRFREIQK
ncbi:hypothetical protein FGO68_gene15501 [Halteria grandinella]|uniref:Uncharacterized protein n=1 Tax=Halteria grandinella TaxID=5974 RepID=A0A8J8NHP6_HALGN|nr:hypothetical protein FGO68_gene15501 [Halteria grandinella]